MNRQILCGAALIANMLAQSAMAGWVYEKNTDDSLSWRTSGHALKLQSNSMNGITVTKVSDEFGWGLQEGDLIVDVDDQPVKHVNELLEKLRASKPTAVKLRVLRGGVASILTVSAADYGNVISPVAPTPPTPPPPPPPLTTSPAMESSWYAYEHNTDDSLSWPIPHHALQLKSNGASGITVTKISPDSLWGLRQGDVITAVDTHPVKHVSQFME